MKKKIGIIGQFPPPMHGLSKALDTLYNSYLNKEFDFTKIDITNNKKFLSNLFKIMFSKLDLYYLTISQSKFGNIRDLIMIKLIQIKRRKIIIHLHGGGFRNILDNEFGNFQKKLNYKILSKVNAGIVLGESLKYIFKGIIPEEKIYVVKNCVDDDYLISEDAFINKLNYTDTDNVLNILYLSNFIQSKGYRYILELAKMEKERVAVGGVKKIHFEFAGEFFDNNERIFFENYIKVNKLEEFVEYHGVVDGENKRKLLERCSIFILLTNYKNEGQPIAILEAMGSGMVIITTNHAGIPDIVKDKVNGYVKDNVKVKHIYNWIIMNRDTFKCIMKKNRECIEMEFLQSNYIENIKRIFES